MIVKKNFSPSKIWQYIKKPMWFVNVWSILVWTLQFLLSDINLYTNFTPIGVLGSALAIFIGFRNNSAYGRWWEARQIWAGIVNASRVLARLVITFTDSHAHQPNYDQEKSATFKRKMVYFVMAWAHALRLQLRDQEDWSILKPFLTSEDYDKVSRSQNRPTTLQLLIGKEIYEAMGSGTLGGFDSFQMEGQMLALANLQGTAEKIKTTPLPRQYDYFTRVFAILFALLLPFGMLSFFQSPDLQPLSWLSAPLSILISGVFVIMERTGAANEDPFENQITDVPMTSLCNTIERDLKEMLGESLPEKMEPEHGYLF